MAWRLARSLVTLRAEVRALHPGTTVWDIGDPSHQAGASDHNPNPAGVVCAIDVLGNAGLRLSWFAERVRAAGLAGHPAPKYVIFNRRIASRSQGWRWRTYSGTNPHTTHVHVSVGTGPDGRSTGPYDNTTPWGIEEDEVSAEDVWQHRILNPRTGNADTAATRLLDVQSDLDRLRGVPTAMAELRALVATLAGQDLSTAAHQAVRDEMAAQVEVLADGVAARVPAAGRAEVAAALHEALGVVDAA